MGSGTGFAWLFHASGWALAVGALLLALWALFWDRSRGRARCPKCWYDMRGSVGLRCPECGREARSSADFMRTRRRGMCLLLAMVVAVGAYLAYFTPRIRLAGWPGVMPTAALIWWVKRYEPPEVYVQGRAPVPSGAASELGRRCGAGELWGWQWRYLVSEFDVIRCRPDWPAGTPWKVAVASPGWLTSNCSIHAMLPPELWYVPSYPPDATERVGKVPAMGIAVETQMLKPDSTIVLLRVCAAGWEGNFELLVRQVSRLDDAITPVRSSELDETMKRVLRVGLRADANPSTGTDLLLGANLYREQGPVPDDVAVGVTVELLRDDQVMGSWPLLLHDSRFALGHAVDWIRIATPAPGWNLKDPSDAGRWKARVRGDAATALGDLRRSRYWAGEFEVPLQDYLLDQR